MRRPAHERHLEDRLVYVVRLVGRREDLRLVDVVNLQRLQNLRLDEVSDTGLRHHRDAHGLLNTPYHLRVAHSCDPTLSPYISRHSLQRHHRNSPRLLGYPGLLGVHHVHDDPALEHLGHTTLYPESPGLLTVLRHASLPLVLMRFARN